ncbi:hypothetical protein HJFPF1_13335 [Paramyrothecium foliicola]|nr:hypothetical protein HJFPF1_13335 [Paramyrothecium foliicola]
MAQSIERVLQSSECITAFRAAIKSLFKNNKLCPKTFRQYESSCSSLVLWDSAYGVSKGELDETLTQSRRLSQAVLEPLVSICKTLSKRLLPLLSDEDELSHLQYALAALATEAGAGLDEDDSSSIASESGTKPPSLAETNKWDEIAEDLLTDVQCLVDLKSLMGTPAPDVTRPQESQYQAEAQLEPPFAFREQISNKFPNADATIVDRLAKANWERFLRTSELRAGNLISKQENENEKNASSRAETLPPQSEQISKFNDSGLGTSIHTDSAYAETAMSYHHDDQTSVRIPLLPAKDKKGEVFECLACGRDVRAHNNSMWKKHLFTDLQPWICHYLDCSNGHTSFSDREGWIEHLALEHAMEPEWKSFQCPFCLETTGCGKTVITKHLSSHMEEISPSALSLGDDPGKHSASGDLEEHDGKEHAFKCATGHCKTNRLGWSNMNEFLSHVHSEHPRSRCVSDDCPPIFLDGDHFDTHVRTVHLGSNPCIISSHWSIDESKMFWRLLDLHGSHWAAISKSLPQKTPSMVKNYYTTQKDRCLQSGQGNVETANKGLQRTQQPGVLGNGVHQQIQVPHMPVWNPEAKAMVDAMDLPPQLISQIPHLPGEVKKWRDLKIWLSQNDILPQNLRGQLGDWQQYQFYILMDRRASMERQQQQPIPNHTAISILSQPGLMDTRPMNSIPAHVLQVTPQEMKELRASRPNLDKVPDEHLRLFMQQMKKNDWLYRINKEAAAAAAEQSTEKMKKPQTED